MHTVEQPDLTRSDPKANLGDGSLLPDAVQWRLDILIRYYSLMHTGQTDNFDLSRYGEEARNVFYAARHAQYLDHFIDHWSSFFGARQLLADATSRDLFDDLILFRLLGHLHVRLPMSDPETLARISVPDDWKVAETSDQGMFGPLSMFTVPVDSDLVWIKGWTGNISAFLAGQYYLDREVQVQPALGEHVVDAGGCFGDTAMFFAQRVGALGRVYTFDPLKKHCEIMREVAILNGPLGERIQVFEAGLSDVDEAGSANTGGDINPGARVGHGSGLTLTTIDSVVASGDIARIDFIKMDIEGSELAALKGGVRALRKWRPKLAISIYHKPEDFYEIPLWIHSLELGYKFYVDHYSIHSEETVLYGIASSA